MHSQIISNHTHRYGMYILEMTANTIGICTMHTIYGVNDLGLRINKIN